MSKASASSSSTLQTAAIQFQLDFQPDTEKIAQYERKVLAQRYAAPAALYRRNSATQLNTMSPAAELTGEAR